MAQRLPVWWVHSHSTYQSDVIRCPRFWCLGHESRPALWVDLFTPKKSTTPPALFSGEAFISVASFERVTLRDPKKCVLPNLVQHLSILESNKFNKSTKTYYKTFKHFSTCRIMWRMITAATKHPAGHCVLDKSPRIRLTLAAVVRSGVMKGHHWPSPCRIRYILAPSFFGWLLWMLGSISWINTDFRMFEGQEVPK